jgi:nucleoside-diphosphate-sugar epimerase
MKKKGIISILGCGWLGFPLATSLISKGFAVKASTTSPEKLEVFSRAGIDPYLVHFDKIISPPDLQVLLEAETLIITIPPGRKNPDGFNNYIQMVKSICEIIPNTSISSIIFISSTSVYPNANNIVDEFSDIFPETESGKLLADSEILLRNLPVRVIILRLAGLIGPQRMPGFFFAGKTQMPNGQAPVNLIHRNDVINIIHLLIENPDASGIYNACAPSHPTKTEFYTLAAEKENLELPQFIPEKISWKIISSVRLEPELNFRFEIPSLMQWLFNMNRIKNN